jgi:hypothetical protein
MAAVMVASTAMRHPTNRRGRTLGAGKVGWVMEVLGGGVRGNSTAAREHDGGTNGHLDPARVRGAVIYWTQNACRPGKEEIVEEGMEYTEDYELKGEEVLAKIKELVHEGNVRRIIITSDEGKRLIEIPLTVGVVGALFVPVWAAIGAIAAVVTKCTVEVIRTEE